MGEELGKNLACRWVCSRPWCRAEYRDPAPISCTRCGSPLWRRPDKWAGRTVDYTPRKPSVVSAAILSRRRFDNRKAGECFRVLTGRPEVPPVFVAVLSGPPSGGKSTLAIRALEDGTFHNPLLVAAEEGVGQGLAERLARAEATRSIVTDAADFPSILEVAKDVDADVVCLDSATALRADASCIGMFRELDLSLLAVLQVTKSKEHLGGMGWMHEADLFLWVEEMQWSTKKSWVGKLEEGSVLE